MTASCAFAADLNQSCNLEQVKNHEMDSTVENEFSDVHAFENDNLESPQFGLDNTNNVTENVAEMEGSPDVIPASYDDLCHDIENLKPDSTYDIKKDYIIENCGDDLSKNRIINIIADNVIIMVMGIRLMQNGNRGYFAVFNVTGNNVTIVNLNIINARIYNNDYTASSWNRYGDDYNRVVSPIEWRGDNGFLLNCVFDDNVGEDGGAIYWAGNNGLIDNCYFNDNAAVRGGSIFMCGYNNTIRNSVIKDSYSDYLDSIFLKNFDENRQLLELNIKNCTFENYMSFINDFHVERFLSGNKGQQTDFPCNSCRIIQ